MKAILDRSKNFCRVRFPILSEYVSRRATARRWVKASAILADSNPPKYCDSEEVFACLQAKYPSRDWYRYDSLSCWSRGVERAQQLLALDGLANPGLRVLEAGCGDGMTGYALASYGHAVTLVDFEDWRDDRVKALPFLQSDLCSHIAMQSETCDLICSYNTFEHLADPAEALSEFVRLCTSGGLIYLEFNPLYASPWGLHAYRISGSKICRARLIRSWKTTLSIAAAE
jgi:SAM-dependent methyltransferase